MAFSYGRQFRRIAAQALTAEPDEMRASIARLLPPREDGGARVLRLETEADCEMAPAVVVAAFFADLITGDEGASLLAQALDRATRKRVQQERRAAEDPLAKSIRAWRAGARGEEPVNRGHRPVRSHWDAPPQLVKNKENTSAAGEREAADHSAESTAPS
jgi:hypothetical protein